VNHALQREHDEQIVCAECSREPRDKENAAEEWRATI
jgi:hypothetical protein